MPLQASSELQGPVLLNPSSLITSAQHLRNLCCRGRSRQALVVHSVVKLVFLQSQQRSPHCVRQHQVGGPMRPSSHAGGKPTLGFCPWACQAIGSSPGSAWATRSTSKCLGTLPVLPCWDILVRHACLLLKSSHW